MNIQNPKHPTTSAEPAMGASNGVGIVMRTDLGPTIAGTRINIYDIMDYLHEDWPPKLIRDWLGLTEAQIDSALSYIRDNQEQVEKDYRQLEQEAEENRQYWEEFARTRPKPEPAPETPEKAALRARLEEWKRKLNMD